MKSNEIRQLFLDYFQHKQHQMVKSSSLVPANDPSLLFTNAGMVQFKDTFLGKEQRDYQRAVSSQRCVRAGGKHNDLENVGYTARHHTFFEMLGNFSFGDYFKREAIHFAWDFLTNTLQLPKEKLWVTVFEDDDEAAAIWLDDINVDPARMSRCGEKDNFWSMGDTGPCGPCSEIFYDHGDSIPGGPPGSPDEDGDRYIEIWNLVFMQYNRDASGQLTPLPKPSVDTGMGLERIAAVMQHVHNNYDIDTFQSIIQFTAQLANISDFSHTSLRVLADHIRSAAFLIVDGIVPANEGRGYVLRRIMRRALRHGHKLGLDNCFFYKLVSPLVAEMGEAYPELIRSQDHIEQTILREEKLFAETLAQGMKIFDQETATLSERVIPGDVVFKLYDTYGFPMDLTADIARERGLEIDEPGFHQAMTQQRERSKQASKFAAVEAEDLQISTETHFVGYEQLSQQTTVTAMFKAGQVVEELQAGDEAQLVLASTPFYAESGGQVGDSGVIQVNEQTYFTVQDVQKHQDAIVHHGVLTGGNLQLQQSVHAKVDGQARLFTAYNHSATHLLHAALRDILGNHVIQKGSLVDGKRLRFDFSHFEALSTEQLMAIEALVNAKIRANLVVETSIMTPEEAMDKGAVALFGEKYGKEVRVLTMGDFSMELCGGTHVSRTGDIGLFKLVSETGIAAGIRRLEAVTGQWAYEYIQQQQHELGQAAHLLSTQPANVVEKIGQLTSRLKATEKHNAQLKSQIALSKSATLLDKARDVQGIQTVVAQLDDIEPRALRDIAEQLRAKLSQGIIFLASEQAGRVHLVAAVSNPLCKTYKAGDLMKYIAQQVSGKGGGRPDMAQGSGSDLQQLPHALDSVYGWVAEQQIA